MGSHNRSYRSQLNYILHIWHPWMSDYKFNDEGRTRDCEYEGITLEEALKFNDDDWCRNFFQSIVDMHEKDKNRFLFVHWYVEKANLSDNCVKWQLIFNKGQRGGYPEKGFQKKDFGSKLDDGYEPHMFEDHEREDLIMICPGKGDGTGVEGGIGGSLQDGRCKHVVNFMCSGETEYEEKKKMWQLVGETTLQRMNGELMRKKGIDEKEHDALTISTHGFGVSWLHVRVEADPKYKDLANL